MPVLPQRQFLAGQTAAVLRDEIAQGTWREWLPSERALCEQLQVSRNTLRAALGQLQRDGLVRAEHGAGNRILAAPGPVAPVRRSRDVGLLSPEPLEHLRPTQTLWIDELRALLAERECRLHVFHGRQYFRASPAVALQRLVAKHAHGAWILTLSNEAIQRWFAERGVPCVVAGSVHAGLPLASRDLDHRAMCRHAAGVLLGLGHRRLALVIAQSRLAGDLESEAGFDEGMRGTKQAGAEAAVCRHDGTVPGITNALRRLFERESPPTALVVANAYHYLTVVSRLAQMGRRVPQDVAVVSRDEDPFLSFLVPSPARYVVNPRAMARALLEPVLALSEGRAVAKPTVRLMPAFVRGESVAAGPVVR
jgi:LacI family transcriptional regulator